MLHACDTTTTGTIYVMSGRVGTTLVSGRAIFTLASGRTSFSGRVGNHTVKGTATTRISAESAGGQRIITIEAKFNVTG